MRFYYIDSRINKDSMNLGKSDEQKNFLKQIPYSIWQYCLSKQNDGQS